MSDSRERRPISVKDLEKVLARALKALREAGASSEDVEAMLRYPIDLWFVLPMSDAPTEEVVRRAWSGDEIHAQIATQQFRAWLQIGQVPSAVLRDYVLGALADKDERALGWKGSRAGPKRLSRDRERFAQAVLVWYLAEGKVERKADALKVAANFLGYSRPDKLKESMNEPEEPWYWHPNFPAKDRAAMAVGACRVLLASLKT